jgi:hypothetical protein
MQSRAIGIVAALALLCSACTGGGGSLPGVGARSAGVPGGGAAAKGVKVAFDFKIPRRQRHRAHYLSPGTASIEVTVFNAAHTQKLGQSAIDTTAGAGSCSTVVGGTFGCTLAMRLAPGSYTFDVAAFDEANEHGAKLSAIDDFARTVATGVANTIPMTLGGIPASLSIALLGSSVFATGNAVSGYQFAGVGSGATQQIQLTAKDAAGFTIVNPGAPAFTLTSSLPAKLSVAAASGVPGVFNVTPLQETNALPVPDAATAITLTATAVTHGTGTSPLSATATVQNDPIAYVGSSDALDVQAFAPWNASPVLSFPLVERDVVATAVDRLGKLYVADFEANSVSVYPPGNTTASLSLSGLTSPDAVVVDTQGNIYVEEFEADVIEFNSAGVRLRTLSSVSSPTGIDGPLGMVLDAANNLYVANFLGNVGVAVFAPGSSVAPAYTFENGMNRPSYPVFDTSGNLYVSNAVGNNVSEYGGPAPFTAFSTNPAATPSAVFGTGTLDDPNVDAVDGSKNVYVGNHKGNDVVEFAPNAPSTVVRSFALPGSSANFVSVDPLGNVYVPADATSSGPVSVYPPGTSTTSFNNWSTGLVFPETITVWP